MTPASSARASLPDVNSGREFRWLHLMPPTRKIHGLEGIPGLNGFEWFRVVLSGVESFLMVLSGVRWFRVL